jgi:hypothetical protein
LSLSRPSRYVIPGFVIITSRLPKRSHDCFKVVLVFSCDVFVGERRAATRCPDSAVGMIVHWIDGATSESVGFACKRYCMCALIGINTFIGLRTDDVHMKRSYLTVNVMGVECFRPSLESLARGTQSFESLLLKASSFACANINHVIGVPPSDIKRSGGTPAHIKEHINAIIHR